MPRLPDRCFSTSHPCLAAALLLSSSAAAEAEFLPTIGEFLASNTSVLTDEDGDFSDWIEIRNSGDSAGDLTGWTLTDNPENPGVWTFPSIVLEPGEFALVFASGKNRAVPSAELHTNFKLSAAGEYLALVKPDGTTLASAFDPGFPQQYADVSYGSEGYYENPTPGAANGLAGPAPIPPVDFAPGSIIFANSQLVTLSNATAGTTITYTTDGTEPSVANGTGYTTPIEITATTTLRARAQLSDADAGPTSERNYLKLAADTQNFTSPLPIVILDNFGAGAIPRRNNSTGPNGNDGSGVIQVARQPVLLAIFDRDAEGQATPAATPAITSHAGIRVRGSSSAGLAKKSFSLETWEDGEIEASDNIRPFGMPSESDWVLYAPTETFGGNRYDRPLLHNSFIYQLSNEIGRYATRTQFVEVFLNTGGGELSMDDYAGLYIFMESRKRDGDRIDFEKLSQDGTAGGWMINADRMDPKPIGGVGTPRHFHTPGPNRVLQTADDSPFGVRNIDDRPEFYHSFFNFDSPGGYTINAAQRSAIQDAMNAFEDALYGSDWTDPELGYTAWIDVDNFIDHFILHNLTKNQDAFVLSTLLYRTGPTAPIRFGPIWDFDRGYTTSPTNPNPTSDLLWAANRMWFPRLFADDDFEQKYIDRWQALREGAFATRHLHAIIDCQVAEITGPVALRNGTTSWPSKVTAMKNWLASRSSAIDAQFIPKPNYNVSGGAVPENFGLVINGSAGATVYYTTDGSDPRLPGGGIAPTASVFEGGPIDTALASFDSACRYHIPTDDSLGPSWTGAPEDFDDSTWTAATPGLGWEGTATGTLLAQINTSIQTEMRNVNATGYFRWPFDFDNAANINSLTLSVHIDDGFVAYLNGTEIGGFNAPSPVLWDSAATDRRSDSIVLSTPIVIDATAFKSSVRDASNTLAIHGLNRNAGDSDFLIRAQFEVNHTVANDPVNLTESGTITARAKQGTDWSGPAIATFVVGTTPADATNIVVSEIMYNPAPPTQSEIDAGILDGDQFEYIELMNISARDVDLSGTTFTDGIGFEFPSGIDSVFPSGGRVLVVKSLEAFEMRYGPSDLIAGEFDNDGNLRDSGEALTLSAIDATPIRSFTYDDKRPWPEAADGDGYSLVLIAPTTDPDHALAGNWRTSALPGGTPTTTDATTFPGGDFLTYATAGSGPTISSATTISFQRNLAADDVLLTIQTSTDLQTWIGAISGALTETPNGDGTSTIRYDAPTAPNQYFRLEARERP